MGLGWGFLGAMTALSLMAFWNGSTTRRREVEVFAFLERVGLPMTDQVYDRVNWRLLNRYKGSALGSLGAVLVFALLYAITHGSWPIGVAGTATTGVLGAAMALGGAVSALHQFTAPPPGAPRFARVQVPTLMDYVHPGWMFASTILTVVSVGMSAVLLLGMRPAAVQGGLPLAAACALAVLAVAGIVAAAALSTKFLAVPQPASSQLELQWDDALRAYALRDLWIASIALSTAGFVALLSLLLDVNAPFIYVGLLIGLSPLVLLGLPVSRRPVAVLWQPSQANDPSRC